MSVTTLWRSRSVSVVSLEAKGPTHPCRLGLMPPVTVGKQFRMMNGKGIQTDELQKWKVPRVCATLQWHFSKHEKQDLCKYSSATTRPTYFLPSDKERTHQPYAPFGPLSKITRHLRQIGMIILSIQHHQSQFWNGMSL